jgi:calcineurin-like phosphoesterase family protein
VKLEKKSRMRRQHSVSVWLAVLILSGAAFGLAGCGAGPDKHVAARSGPRSEPGSEGWKPKDVPKPFVLVGAGDIAGCSALEGAEATAKLIERIPGTVFAAGDLAYERGTAQEFRDCYGTTWGRFKERTRPTPGNHEYSAGGGAAYFAYWGQQAGTPEKSYYSFDLGKWHVIALNTNCKAPGVGGCQVDSPQEKWLKQDLAAHANSCMVAFGHHALYSSGVFRSHAVHPELRDLWRDLYEARADLVLAGHEHSYERFAPQDPDGNAAGKNGIREIVVGTGGRSHDPLGTALLNSEVRNVDTYGVLKLTLWPDRYAWEFIPVNSGGFRDSGEQTCHNARGE